MTKRSKTSPPAGLSPDGQALWLELHRETEFTADSEELLRRALGTFDLADSLLERSRRAEKLSDERALLSAHRDALQTALKFMKAVGLDKADPDARSRLGRRPGDAWSPIRRQARNPLTGQPA